MPHLTLKQSQYYELKEIKIGERIRYIRELLHNHYGSMYSTRGVAERVEIISYAALSSIERGDTKDPTARVLHALSKDFEVDLYIFFDDYYEKEYSPIDLGYKHNKSTPKTKQPDTLLESSNGNRVVVEVYEVSDQMDRRNLVSVWSKHQLDKSYAIQLMASIHQQIDTLDKILGEELSAEADKSSYFWAKEHYDKRTQAAFPWIPEVAWILKRNEMFSIGLEHTGRQLEEKKLLKKEGYN